MSQVLVKTISEGETSIIIRVDMLSDGVTGELVQFPILKPTQLNPPHKNNGPAFRLIQAWYGLVWFDVILGTNTLHPQQLWTIARDSSSHVCFRDFGGLADPCIWEVPPDDDQGTLWISTNGFAPAGSQGTIVLDIKKTTFIMS
jgi:hypothetical protein